MSTFLLWLESGVSFAIAVMVLLVLKGLLPIAIRWQLRDTVWHFATGLLLVVGALALRVLYWSYMPIDIRTQIGKPLPNTLFGLIALYGGYLILRLQLLIIPEIDRGKYTIWSAPWYPHDTNWRLGIILRFLRKRKEEQ